MTAKSSVANTLHIYWQRVRSFSHNARWYLINAAIAGIGMGVFRLLFNPYALSLGFSKANLGEFASAANFTAFVVAMPLGMVADILGHKRALILRAISLALGISLVVLFPTYKAMLLGNVLLGVGMSLLRVIQSPFLTANSSPEHRSYLFSLTSATRMGAMFAGNLLGGVLPEIFAPHFPNASAFAYSIGFASLAIWLSAVPLLALREPSDTFHPHSKADFLAPLAHMVKQKALIAKLVTPYLLISFGAGLFMPFMNVFYIQKYHLSTAQLGTLFAAGSLMMGIGLFIAPALAERIGKMRLVAVSQGLSIPFLAVMGFAPWYWLSAVGYLARLLLMNMSGPQYNAFTMESVTKESRAVTSSALSMIWNLGRSISPLVAGIIWERFGFSPLFVAAIILYSSAVALYVPFFLVKRGAK